MKRVIFVIIDSICSVTVKKYLLTRFFWALKRERYYTCCFQWDEL